MVCEARRVLTLWNIVENLILRGAEVSFIIAYNARAEFPCFQVQPTGNMQTSPFHALGLGIRIPLCQFTRAQPNRVMEDY